MLFQAQNHQVTNTILCRRNGWTRYQHPSSYPPSTSLSTASTLTTMTYLLLVTVKELSEAAHCSVSAPVTVNLTINDSDDDSQDDLPLSVVKELLESSSRQPSPVSIVIVSPPVDLSCTCRGPTRSVLKRAKAMFKNPRIGRLPSSEVTKGSIIA